MLGVIAQKGGTGKTTLSVHLAVQATLDGARVLLLDMDPQASATAWWKRRRDKSPELIQGRGDALAGLLQQAQGQAFDLVITDMTMPHMDGRQTAEAIRQVMPDVPIVLSSGYSEQELANRVAGRGMAGFLQKPYRYEVFTATLMRACRSTR